MEHYLIQFIGIVLFAGVLTFVGKMVIRRIQPSHIWSQAALYSLRKPFYFFIWLTVLALATLSLSHTLYRGGVLLILMWTVFRFINRFEQLATASKYNAARIAQFSRVSALVLGGICLLQLSNIPLSGLLAFGGMGGLAVGFAAKDLFANVFGGFMIFLDQPFRVGDSIRSPTQEMEGTVEHIGWRLTQIRTPGKSLIFVPNTLFSTLVVENLSPMSHRQIQLKLTLHPMDLSKTHQLLSEIDDYLTSHPEVHKTLPHFVNLVSWSPHGPEISIQAYTHTLKYQEVQQEVLFKILATACDRGFCRFSIQHF